MDLNEGAATTLALVLHELATNSLKYGALSVPAGTLEVTCDAPDEEVVLVWTEDGGPPVTPPAGHAGTGYGSELIRRSMMQHFGGGIAHDWAPEGLIVTLRMQRDRLAA
jgi:two-component sensor histidine kinase